MGTPVPIINALKYITRKTAEGDVGAFCLVSGQYLPGYRQCWQMASNHFRVKLTYFAHLSRARVRA